MISGVCHICLWFWVGIIFFSDSCIIIYLRFAGVSLIWGIGCCVSLIGLICWSLFNNLLCCILCFFHFGLCLVGSLSLSSIIFYWLCLIYWSCLIFLRVSRINRILFGCFCLIISCISWDIRFVYRCCYIFICFGLIQGSVFISCYIFISCIWICIGCISRWWNGLISFSIYCRISSNSCLIGFCGNLCFIYCFICACCSILILFLCLIVCCSVILNWFFWSCCWRSTLILRRSLCNFWRGPTLCQHFLWYELKHVIFRIQFSNYFSLCTSDFIHNSKVYIPCFFLVLSNF